MATLTESPARSVERRRGSRTVTHGQSVAGYAFSALYVVLLGGFALLPALYAIYLAFVRPEGGFAWLSNFETVITDYRYVETFKNLGIYALMFLVPTMVVSIGLALLLHGRRPAVASTFRVVYYLPHSVIGVAAVLLWLFLLTPRVSPIGGLLQSLGFDSLYHVVRPSSPASLAVLFAIIAVWTSGQGILLMFAALSSVPREIEEAASIDGANSWQLIWRIKLPLLRKWVAYLLIVSVAASTQLFAEPQLMSAVTNGAVGENFSPLQLAYTYAYQYGNFPASAALSIQLLLLGILAAVLVVKKTGLFRVEI
ncbi:carbohydrate ABC transporter permease [Ruania alba]|uniref:Carbohydrate ABC transporter membrane protein 1, CUT1 family n=1 Tax=Ruania alba TaxID=648782 RepID=A0A1H5M8G4_9MICO|nr:sugar ABC transporter permease [Ruania alba]SEE85011.1 carbohydrate ABC transporter membrane protein 1, CUT1 family [Ruania alba]